MTNIHVIVSYDGSAYAGWQRQSNKKTVQGELERTFSRMLGEPVTIHGAGRTDTGVHAHGQSFTFRYHGKVPVENLKRFLGSKLEKSIRLEHLAVMPPDFHARYSAVGKTYVYRIRTDMENEVFLRNHYCFEPALDVEAMKQAAGYLIGRHDFTSFSSNGDPKKRHDKVREIKEIRFGYEGDILCIRFTGNGFLYRMVRLIMHHLLEVGRGRRTPESTAQILASRCRKKTAKVAPASGLYLEKVHY